MEIDLSQMKIKEVIAYAKMECGGDFITMKWLMDHFDDIADFEQLSELYYQNAWDENDPSWEWKCGKYNIDNFCEDCGLSYDQGATQ